MLNELAFASRNKHERHFHPQLRVLQPSNSILEISVALKKEGKIKENKGSFSIIFLWAQILLTWWKFSWVDIKTIFRRSDLGSKISHLLVVQLEMFSP